MLSADKQLDEYRKNVGIDVKTIKEICQFLPKSKRKAGYGNKEGTYSFYTSSAVCNKYSDTYDYEGDGLIIGTGGNANIKYGTNFSCSTDNFIVRTISEEVVLNNAPESMQEYWDKNVKGKKALQQIDALKNLVEVLHCRVPVVIQMK